MYSPSFYIDKYESNNRSTLPQNVQNVYYTFFSKENVDYMSNEITKRLAGVHSEGKNIIVPNETILSVMDSIYKNTYRDIDKMTMMTVSFIVDHISSEMQMERQNESLNAWVMNYPPEYGMQQVPQIKLREKRPTPMIFNMNY